jgi:hypothetical protein
MASVMTLPFRVMAMLMLRSWEYLGSGNATALGTAHQEMARHGISSFEWDFFYGITIKNGIIY